MRRCAAVSGTSVSSRRCIVSAVGPSDSLASDASLRPSSARCGRSSSRASSCTIRSSRVQLQQKKVELDRLCEQSDFISLHAPLTPDTAHIINGARLALRKPTAILVNTARGGLVDQSALVEALRNQRIFGAGVDVFETEPPLRDNPLFGLANAVLSDHTAWYSEESVTELQTKAAEEVVRVFRGEQPKHWVNHWPNE